MNAAARLRHVGAVCAFLAVSIGGTAGCGGKASAPAGVPIAKVKPLNGGGIPDSMLGLQVTAEDSKQPLAGLGRTYADRLSFYSLRADDLLQATLQIIHFAPGTDYTSANFQATAVNQVGGARPRRIRLGDEHIYLTKATKQRVSLWFDGQYMFVLSVRDDFSRPRSLLREALAISPEHP